MNGGFLRFGEFRALALDFGRLRIRRPRPETPDRMLNLPVAPCLLSRGSRLVLVDAGFAPGVPERLEGVAWLRPPRSIGEQLAAASLRPEDVDEIVLTHLHDDHASGILRANCGRAYYPRARVHLQREALAQARALIGRGGERYVREELLEHLAASPSTVLHEGDWSLEPGLDVIHTGGHTPGHQAVLAGGGEECLLFGGDLLAVRSAFQPGFRTGVDTDQERAGAMRGKLVETGKAGTFYLYHAHEASRFFRIANDDTAK